MKHILLMVVVSLISVACHGDTEQSQLDDFQKSNIRAFELQNTQKLSLTFDDGPSDHTDVLLDLLAVFDIKATFFINGKNVSGVERDQRLATLQRMYDEGHIVANHSQEHLHMGRGMSKAELRRQVRATHEVIQDFVGEHRLYFRAPYGEWAFLNAGVLNQDAELRRYIGPVFWTVGGQIRYADDGQLAGAADWDCWGRQWSVAECADGYLAEIRAQQGGVVLMHDVTAETVDLVSVLLSALIDEGYTFITLDDVTALDQFETASGDTFFPSSPVLYN